jgi:NAD(P)-dependent dehydrogenase (short-subunit alcohol dehydrogenase family)
MSGEFEDKIVLVTGAGSGIGREAARLYAARGARVFGADVNEQGLSETRDLIAATGGLIDILRVDVASETEIAGFVAHITDTAGRLDIAFNNAGITGGTHAIEDYPTEDFDRVIAVNLRSVFLGMKYEIAAMLRTGGGAIVNTASVDGLAADQGMPAYNAAKGGVVNYTRSLALECARHNIRVNAVCPGWIADTPMTAHMATVPEVSRAWAKSVPLGRGGKSVEVAEVMVFLASDAASYVSGAIVPVDGALLCETGFPRLLDLPV